MKENAEFIHIIGCCRSGTTILGRIIERRLKVAIPWEAHFIPIFQRFAWLWGDLAKEKNRRRLLEAIFDFLELFTTEMSHGADMPKQTHFNYEQIKNYTLLAVKDRAEKIIKETDSYQGLVEAIYREYANIHGLSHFGDKSVSFRDVPTELTHMATPNAKYIHIIRDGRDVALSWRQHWNGPWTLSEAAWLWGEHVRRKRVFGAGHPDQYMEVRYEDLLDDEEAVLLKISQFLGLPLYEDSSADVGLGRLVAESPIMSLGNQPVVKENQGKWKSSMSPEDVALFNHFAGATLRSSGNEENRNEPVAGVSWATAAWERAHPWLLTLFSFKKLRVRIKMRLGKKFLPLALFVFQLLGIDLVKLLGRRGEIPAVTMENRPASR